MSQEDLLDLDKITKIKTLLKFHPKGLTITEISKKLKISRISVARYLDVLLVTGRVEMKAYGAAKAFFLSTRVPISAVLSFSSDLILILNSSLHILQINEKFCSFLGVDQREILGQPLSIEPLKFLERLPLTPIDEGGAISQEINSEIEMMKNEKPHFFEVKILPTVFDDGSHGFTIILHDITEKKLAEEADSFIASIVKNSNDAIISKDLNGMILGWNHAAELMYGYQPEEIVGRSVSLLIPESKSTELSGIIETIKQGGSVHSYETKRVRKSGEIIDVSVTISPIRNKEGELVAISTIARDLSQIKQMKDEIRIKAEKLNEIIEFLPDPIIVIDRQRKILGWNRAIEEFSGIKKDNIVGKSYISELKAIYGTNRPLLIDLVEKPLEEIMQYYPNARKEGKSIVIEGFYDRVKKGKGAHLFIKATPLYDTNGNYIGGIQLFRDITDWKVIENSLKNAHEKIVRELKEQIRNLCEERDRLLKELQEFEREPQAIKTQIAARLNSSRDMSTSK